MLLLLLCQVPALAQSDRISGRVTGPDKLALPGVSIQVSGTTQGTVTDAEGRYTLEAPGNATLIFSYIGFANQTVNVNNRSVIDVMMTTQAKALDEVVVTALGIKREAKTLGYATATIGAEEIAVNRDTNVMSGLQGKMAGVNISTMSSGPGGTSKIRIRGQSSFSGQNNPLIVINGVPVDNSNYALGANRHLGDFGLDMTLDGNTRYVRMDYNSVTVQDFIQPGLYTVMNGRVKDPLYSLSERQVNSLYGAATFSFREYVYLNVTARNDWFSTLAPKNRSILYPSVTGSFVFSQAFEQMPSWLSFGKLRAAYAEVGDDNVAPYSNTLYYRVNNNLFPNPSGQVVPVGGINASTIPNPDLRPLRVAEAEAGLDASKPADETEILYGGKVDKWRRFGYSLMLRAAMRLSKVAPGLAETYAAKAVAGGLMQSNADNAATRHTALYVNWLADHLGAREKANYYLTAPFINFLRDNHDPRLNVIAVRYVGAKSGSEQVNARATTDPAKQVGMPMGYDNVTIAQTFSELGVVSLWDFSQVNINEALERQGPNKLDTRVWWDKK